MFERDYGKRFAKQWGIAGLATPVKTKIHRKAF
jgi:hypothetical protein